MKRSEIDWRYLRQHTLLPFVTAILSLVLLIGSIWVEGQQQQRHARFSSNQDSMHRDYDDLVYRRRLVERYHRRYQQFHDLGFVGRESRLDWVETMRLTSQKLFLPRVSYTLEPQRQVVTPVENTSGSDISFRVSQLDLDMGMVHEMDLLRFFDELQSEAPGLINVDRCRLVWQGDREAGLETDTNIQANCSVQIFSAETSDVLGGVAPL